MKTITVQEIAATGVGDACLLDVRTGGEFAGLHAEGAVNLPLDTVSAEAIRQAAGDRKQVYILCQSGNRARKACDQVGAVEGCELIVVEGGTTAWNEAGLPVVKGKGVISIERQVRIVAGLLVAIGTALGFWVHPGFLGLPAFVGVGLAFAGITDFCGMGLMLAKMPWNRGPGCTTACQVTKSDQATAA